jgi:hypothetical protein
MSSIGGGGGGTTNNGRFMIRLKARNGDCRRTPWWPSSGSKLAVVPGLRAYPQSRLRSASAAS